MWDQFDIRAPVGSIIWRYLIWESCVITHIRNRQEVSGQRVKAKQGMSSQMGIQARLQTNLLIVNVGKDLNSRASQKPIMIFMLQNVKLEGNFFHWCSRYIISSWSDIECKTKEWRPSSHSTAGMAESCD